MPFDFLTLFSTDAHGKYLLVSFQTWVIYETLITVDHSVELFWKQPWNASKALFLINRYAAIMTLLLHTLHQFVTDASTMFCYFSRWLGFIGITLLISVLHLTMLLRINALYSSFRLVKIVMTLFAWANILAFAIWGSYGWSKAIMTPQMPPFTGCVALFPANLKFNMIFILSFVFETCVIILTLIMVYPMVRQIPGRLPLFTMLLNDGIVHYIIIIVSQVFVFSVSFSQNASLLPVFLSSPSIVIGAIICNRLHIRLQEVLLGVEMIESETLTGGRIIRQVVRDETTQDKRSDIRIPSTAYGESGIQQPSQTQKSEV